MTREEKLQDIKDYPEKHRHNFEELRECCTTVDEALDLSLMDAHSIYAPVGKNGGRNCDVTEGPCSCGGWH